MSTLCMFQARAAHQPGEEGTLTKQNLQNFLQVCFVLDRRAFLAKKCHFSRNWPFLHSGNDVIHNRPHCLTSIKAHLQTKVLPRVWSETTSLRSLVSKLVALLAAGWVYKPPCYYIEKSVAERARSILSSWLVNTLARNTVEPGCQVVLVVKRWLVVKRPLACCQKAFVQRRI